MIPELGQILTAKEQTVDPTMMRVWAKALRDPNRIHLDPEAVRAKGLGDRVINQGPANFSHIMNLLLEAFPRGRLTTFKVRFLDNVYGGERVTPSAVVTAIEDTPQGKLISFNTTLHAEARLVLDGQASMLIERAMDAPTH